MTPLKGSFLSDLISAPSPNSRLRVKRSLRYIHPAAVSSFVFPPRGFQAHQTVAAVIDLLMKVNPKWRCYRRTPISAPPLQLRRLTVFSHFCDSPKVMIQLTEETDQAFRLPHGTVTAKGSGSHASTDIRVHPIVTIERIPTVLSLSLEPKVVLSKKGECTWNDSGLCNYITILVRCHSAGKSHALKECSLPMLYSLPRHVRSCSVKLVSSCQGTSPRPLLVTRLLGLLV